MPEVVFLTQDGCANTKVMRDNLDGALRALGRPAEYAVIDIDTLPASDVRTGYGTPTVLADGVDLFGLPSPTPPLPAPT